MPTLPFLERFRVHPKHRKAKVDLRQQNFTDKFEAALNELSQLGLMFDKMQKRFEPHEMRLIKNRLNMARNHIEYIWRESGLKQ